MFAGLKVEKGLRGLQAWLFRTKKSLNELYKYLLMLI